MPNSRNKVNSSASSAWKVCWGKDSHTASQRGLLWTDCQDLYLLGGSFLHLYINAPIQVRTANKFTLLLSAKVPERHGDPVCHRTSENVQFPFQSKRQTVNPVPVDPKLIPSSFSSTIVLIAYLIKCCAKIREIRFWQKIK